MIDLIEEKFLVDDEMLRRFVHLDNRIKKMGEKLQKVYIEESITHREQDYEVNMLLYLDSEYERRRLEQDKLDAKKDLGKDSFGFKN